MEEQAAARLIYKKHLQINLNYDILSELMRGLVAQQVRAHA